MPATDKEKSFRHRDKLLCRHAFSCAQSTSKSVSLKADPQMIDVLWVGLQVNAFN